MDMDMEHSSQSGMSVTSSVGSRTCFVQSCESSESTSSTHYFQLPEKSSDEIRDLWVTNIPKRYGRPWNFEEGEFLCEKHFDEKCIIKPSDLSLAGISPSSNHEEVLNHDWILVDDAIPTIFPPPIPPQIVSISVPVVNIEKSVNGAQKNNIAKTEEDDQSPICVVKDCDHSAEKLREWESFECDEHVNSLRKDCDCPKPYRLFKFPSANGPLGPKNRENWIRNVNRKNWEPTKSSMVCSAHFKNGKPTPSNPIPILRMGYKVLPIMQEEKTLLPLSLNPNHIHIRNNCFGDDDDEKDLPPVLKAEVPVNSNARGRGRPRHTVMPQLDGTGTADSSSKRGRGRPPKRKTSLDSSEGSVVSVSGRKQKLFRSDECCVPGCKSTVYTSNVSLHSFPIDSITRLQWTTWLSRFSPSMPVDCLNMEERGSVMCSAHFESQYFCESQSRGKRLNKNAVPTIFELPSGSGTKSSRTSKASADQSLLKSRPALRSSKTTTPPQPPPSTRDKVSKKKEEIYDGFVIEYDDGINDDNFEVHYDDEVEQESIGAKVEVEFEREPEQDPGYTWLLSYGQEGFDLNYIFSYKNVLQLPSGNWNVELFMDKELGHHVLCVTEAVVRNGKIMFCRAIKVRDDLSFEVDCNRVNVTQMFTETGNKIDSISRLQEIISDFAAYSPCEGWAEFASVDRLSIGHKVDGIWFSVDCGGVCLGTKHCPPCEQLKASLDTRIRSKNGKIPLTTEQIKALPKDDPVRLHLKIQELNNLLEARSKEVRRFRSQQMNFVGEIKSLKSKLELFQTLNSIPNGASFIAKKKTTPLPRPN